MRTRIFHMVGISTLCLGLLIAVPMPAQAQDTAADDRWKFKAAIYLWTAGIQGTTRRGNEIDVGFSDIWDNLDMAFMGAFEARKSKWSLAADVIYLDVSVDKAGTIGPGIPANAEADTTGWVVSLQGARNVLDADRASVNILAGARYLDFDLKLTSSVGGAPLPTVKQSASVWDGVIGVKGNVNVTKKWYLPYYLDAGTGQSDFTWQALGGVGYRFNCCDVVLVYRHMYWDFKSDAALKDISFSGPALGGVFKF